jgi:hypothetical protein
MNLLTENNQKILKGEEAPEPHYTVLLHLAPTNLSGYNTCPMATVWCALACLNTAGHGGMFKKGETTNKVQEARKRRTVMFFEQRDEFMALLVKDIQSAIRKAAKRGMKLAIRLNGTSDIRWETIPVEIPLTLYNSKDEKRVEYFTFANIMSAFPEVQFYDYTKIANRRNLPANYHLTFSLAESNRSDAVTALANGMNVAAVFRTLPETFMGHEVINGDEDDLRFLDPSPCIVGLTAKGKAKKDTSGFVQN